MYKLKFKFQLQNFVSLLNADGLENPEEMIFKLIFWYMYNPSHPLLQWHLSINTSKSFIQRSNCMQNCRFIYLEFFVCTFCIFTCQGIQIVYLYTIPGQKPLYKNCLKMLLTNTGFHYL